VVVASLLLIAGVAIYLVKEALSYPEQRRAGNGTEVPVTIERGMSFPKIADRLADKKIIEKPMWFRLYAMHRGVTTKVRTGEYVLRNDMTPKEVLDRLLEGIPDVTASVTIPEGLHILEVFDIIDEAGIAKRSELEKLGRDPAFLESLGIEGETVEGFLFPDTYKFRVPTSADKVISAMVRQHRIVWEQVRRDNRKSLDKLKKKLGWNERDFLVLASIVEKEAVVAPERPTIAQVFINRLTDPNFRPKKLDTDPTIRYGCTIPVVKSEGCKKWDPSKRLRRAQLDDKDNPYNTYQHEGLPPGPICNPGKAAMAAAMHPDGSRYFFFVSRNNGTHVFSRTRAEHERAVDKFQR
jgi:UPF0755 protein